MEMDIISRAELKTKLDEGDDFKLVFVLRDWEEAGYPLEGDLVGLNNSSNTQVIGAGGVGSDRLLIIKNRVSSISEVGERDKKGCPHFDQIQAVNPNSDVCEQCVELGDTWVNLRICMTCGQVGCCDDSKNTHASKHFEATGHPVIMSFQPGEEWLWCYIDKVLLF